MTQAIFLSYASQDAEVARHICEALRAAGLEVWFDQNELTGGDAWDQKIRKQIKECSLFVPIISANTNAREEGYFRREWNIAVDRMMDMADHKAFLFPVILGDVAEASAFVPDKFRERQWTRLATPESDDAATKAFAARVAKLASGGASSSKNASSSPSNGEVATLATAPKTVAPTHNHSGLRRVGAQVSSSSHAQPNLGPDLHRDDSNESAAHASSGASSGTAPAMGTAAKAVTPNTKPRRALLYGAAALVTVIAIAAAVMLNSKSNTATIDSVAVLPFENGTGDTAIDYLSDGISESLINKLSGLNGLRVISRTSAFSFKGKKLDAIEIGRKLGVDAIVLGTLVQRGESLTITSELVRVSNATQLWGEKYNRRANDVLQVEGEIATTIAQTIRRQLSGEEKAKLTRSATSDPEAYRLYLKGRSYAIGSQQEMDKAIDLLQQAVALAPDYALAHAGLALAYTRQAFLRATSRSEVLGKARAAADRALALDPGLAEAHVALGDILYFLNWDWVGAEAEYKKALALNPANSDAHRDYGAYLVAMGRFDEGLVHSQEASRLDPLSMAPFHDIGINQWSRGDLAKAAAVFRRAIEIDQNWTWGYVKLSLVLANQKQCKDAFVQAAIGEKKIAGGRAPLARSWLGATYAVCGDSKRAREKLAELHEMEKAAYVDPVTFAVVHSSLGEIDEAFRWWEKAYTDRTPNMVFAKQTPQYFSPDLRGDPRYQAIVDRMGFPK